MRERDIRQAAVDLLAATGEFDAVELGKSDPSENPASSRKLCTVDPQDTQESDQWDSALDGGTVYKVRIALEITVRENDAKLRDDEVERLLNVVRNTLNGVSIGGFTLPEFTKVHPWSWRMATAGSRQIAATLNATYFEEGWNVADVTD